MVVRREERDGRRVVVKHTGYDARTEAAGLAALAAAGAHVPEVVDVRRDRLVTMEVVGDGDWEACGARLATVHRSTADGFGRDGDGAIGPLVLPGGRGRDWPQVYWTLRLEPWLDALPTGLARRLRSAADGGALASLLEHDAVPSLVHGDLWSGNVVGGQWLVDPAAQHADRELDLAMAALFGGFPPAFHAGYAAVWPQDAGWRERLPAQQLHHLLVHVALFGGGYVQQVAERLDALGW